MISVVMLLTAVLVTAFFIFWRYRRVVQQRLLGRVAIVTWPDFASSHLGNKRTITIFLPPNYDEEAERRYPVLYVNDGQDMGQLKLHETLAHLWQQQQIEPLIVVAMPTNENRLQEYGTAVAVNAQGLGRLAEAYNRFVTMEVMPAINAQFRTSTKVSDTAVLGASLGGLSAFDLAWNHPDLFGIVGVFSGSFWWRASSIETQITPDMLIAHEMVRRGDYRPLRAWFEAGTRDEKGDRDGDGVIDAIQDTVELMEALATVGLVWGQDMVYVEVKNGRHNYATWSMVLPDFLKWAFPCRDFLLTK